MFVSSTTSHPCSGSGTIQIMGPVGANFQYKIDSQPFQNQPTFLNVKVGKHVLVVKDENGCEINKEVIVETIPKGNTFSHVSQILQNLATYSTIGTEYKQEQCTVYQQQCHKQD